MWYPLRGIRRCGLVGRCGILGGVEWSLEFQKSKPGPSASLFLVPEDPDVDFRTLQYHVYINAIMLPAMLIMDKTSETVSRTQ